MKLGLLFGFAFLAAGCVSTSSVPIGTTHYAPLPPGAPVAVYSHEADVKCAFEPVALVHRKDARMYRVLNLQDELSFLQEEARRDGANGLIIEWSAPIQTGAHTHGAEVQARAILVSECGEKT